jgi:hypothetical protein
MHAKSGRSILSGNALELVTDGHVVALHKTVTSSKSVYELFYVVTAVNAKLRSVFCPTYGG